MKELYIAPEAEIICFAPVEKLASDWDSVNPFSNGNPSGTSTDVTIPVPETTNPSVDGEVGP